MSPSAGRERIDTPVAVGAERSQFTLCAGSWSSPGWDSSASPPVAAERMVPPFSASVSAGTAMPPVEKFGSTTS